MPGYARPGQRPPPSGQILELARLQPQFARPATFPARPHASAHPRRNHNRPVAPMRRRSALPRAAQAMPPVEVGHRRQRSSSGCEAHCQDIEQLSESTGAPRVSCVPRKLRVQPARCHIDPGSTKCHSAYVDRERRPAQCAMNLDFHSARATSNWGFMSLRPAGNPTDRGAGGAGGAGVAEVGFLAPARRPHASKPAGIRYRWCCRC
jgi:hypothetical protein